jgi:hypothetical protein
MLEPIRANHDNKPPESSLLRRLSGLLDALQGCTPLLDDRLVWLNNGERVPISGAVLAEIISTNVVPVRLTNRGSAEKPNWVREYHAFTPPSEKALHHLLRAENRDEGSLLARVALAHIS